MYIKYTIIGIVGIVVLVEILKFLLAIGIFEDFRFNMYNYLCKKYTKEKDIRKLEERMVSLKVLDKMMTNSPTLFNMFALGLTFIAGFANATNTMVEVVDFIFWLIAGLTIFAVTINFTLGYVNFQIEVLGRVIEERISTVQNNNLK